MFANADSRPSESMLLALARAGDTDAFKNLVLAYQSSVRRQLRRLCNGDAALADDLAQETFIQAWSQLNGFRGDARLASWLYRIAYNQFLMYQRSHATMLPQAELPEFADDPTRQRDVQRDLNRAMAQLPEAERIALIHCYQLDLSHDEAARVLGLPLGTLKSHVMRGKARLRILLKAWATEVIP
jgi:RNA polymerase sigma factor (sigma-70 family)